MKDGDYVRKILTTSTHDRILFFTNKGKVYMKTAYDIPESSRTGKGKRDDQLHHVPWRR